MPLVDWYRHKADQCARLAEEATDPKKRARYEDEQKIWLELAAQAECDRPDKFGRKPK